MSDTDAEPPLPPVSPASDAPAPAAAPPSVAPPFLPAPSMSGPSVLPESSAASSATVAGRMRQPPRPSSTPAGGAGGAGARSDRDALAQRQAAGARAGSRAGVAALVLTLLLSGLLAAGLAYEWATPNPKLAGRLAGLDGTVASLTGRVAKLEQAPAAPVVAASPMPAPAAAPSPPNPPPPASPPPVSQPPVPPAPPAVSSADLAVIATRLDQVAARQDALAARQQSESSASSLETARLIDAQKGAIAALTDRLAKAEQAQAALAGLAGRTERLARLQEASASLRLGQPVGAIDGAPPALARYASVAPPSEAGLRLAFPALAEAANQAARPAADGRGFWRRVWARMQGVITIRQGDHVIVGNPAAGLLAHAQATLNAGDLTGTVATLSQLPPEAAAPLQDWLAQARGLLGARAALTGLEAQG